MKPIEIFRVGQHTAMSGDTLTFSESDVAAIATNYNPDLSEAPLVVGHPATDAPAYGWVGKLSFANGILSALPSDVDPAFAELVNARRYSKVSAAFYPPDSPNNPVKGSYYLRHVGFLGAQPPAVKGLKTPQFASDDDSVCFECSIETIQFSTTTGGHSTMTEEELKAKQAEIEAEKAKLETAKQALQAEQTAFAEQQTELKKQQAKTKAAEIDAIVDGLVKEARVLPKDKVGLLAYMTAETPNDVIEFAEGGAVVKKTGHEWLIGFLRALPPQVEFGERTKPEQTTTVNDADVARRARSYKAQMDATGSNISFAEAVDAVLADKDKGAA